MQTQDVTQNNEIQGLSIGGFTNIDEILLYQAKQLVEAMDKMVDGAMPYEIAEIVKSHSKGAGVAALGAAWIPGVGGVAAAAIGGGFIWSMYSRIGVKIGLPLRKNILKSVASGAATNITAAGVATAASSALSLVPGLGWVASDLIMACTCYATTLASGYVYLKIMTHLFSKGIDFSTVSEQELKDMAAEAAKDSDVREVIKEAKADFHKRGQRILKVG